ncbi:conserved domain protein (plasmid) [Bacillus anthracis str. A0488]|uniref:Conserved domain protein n=1 Tax=Bacillus anthracis TaxID=1392 RepID=Q6EZP8_BACAN|nr:hypothetical protein BX_A0120 [Bacillus anthracis str. A2012]AAT28861.2 conserved domain protein [Bacillus anthracis str. 'Ames Ancestor']EDR16427.1 conserved domain protein [Bacillus anthracis str. A0488]EDR85281.1 conserved domain protein [Bacillus anthracis str. A0193]EDR90523.1 conserved domain protein [Bacillus anthracis str. A0442]EDS94478.1 conserved domain protein [Bacillus anthracis str. A0389]EDT17087.1 conserved domain protein [Bacillus anthracis str. A0465]EDT64794.1 conserved
MKGDEYNMLKHLKNHCCIYYINFYNHIRITNN